jgi:hypothetical protein
MKLFKSRHPVKSIPIDSNTVETPLGKVTFDLRINKNLLSTISTDRHSYQLYKGGKILCYFHSDFIAELVICEPDIRIPPHLKLDKVYGAVWRVKSLINHLKCEYYSVLNPDNPLGIDGGTDSGEHLEALTWDYKEHRLTLGTQDGVKLVHRAEMNDLMPNRFKATDEISQHSIVQILENGFNVPVPELMKNELCQVHFVIAWNKCEREDDVSTWFAVDLEGKSILSKEELY